MIAGWYHCRHRIIWFYLLWPLPKFFLYLAKLYLTRPDNYSALQGMRAYLGSSFVLVSFRAVSVYFVVSCKLLLRNIHTHLLEVRRLICWQLADCSLNLKGFSYRWTRIEVFVFRVRGEYSYYIRNSCPSKYFDLEGSNYLMVTGRVPCDVRG